MCGSTFGIVPGISIGNITGSISEAIDGVRELITGDLGGDEPMLRARFIEYIRTRG